MESFHLGIDGYLIDIPVLRKTKLGKLNITINSAGHRVIFGQV